MVTLGECCWRVFVSPTSLHRHTIVAIVTDNKQQSVGVSIAIH